MDDKQMQELNALEQAAFNDPVNFLNQEHNPRKWTLSSEDIARSYSITPAQLLHTEDELNPRKWNVAETLAREFGTGAINMFESAAEGIANSKLQKVIYRSNNMSKEDADRLVEDVLRSQVISRNRQNLEHARRVHDVWSAGIANGIGSVASMALVGAATKSPIAVGALTGIGEAYNVRNEMIDRYTEEKGTTEGVAGKLPEYNALSAAYGVVAGAIEGSIGVERLAAGSLNRYGKLAAMERLARQQGKYGKALAYKTGREFVATGAEEAGEEFLQSISEDVAVALVQDMWEDPDLKKALTQGMFGAIVGAPAGAIFYNGSRKRIIDYINKWNEDKKAGLTESQVVQMTDEILGNGAHTMVDDITTRVEIKEHFGKAYDLVKQRLTEQIDATGTTPWTDQNKSKEEYIQTLADSITIPAINVANMLHIPLSDFLEIADINTATIAGNIAWLRPITSIADIDTIIANQDAIIKEQTEAKKLGVGNEDVLNRARQRKAIAQRVRKDLAIENGIRTQRSNRKKENADYITAKDLQLEQVQTLENATQAQPGQEYVLFAGKRIPVEYQVVELATIQPSHIDGMPNPAYTNTELQNRASRGTTQDVADLREKATNITPERLMRASTSAEGAPVVNAQGQVIAGNGRTEIIRYAYQNPESAEKYKQELVKQGFNIDGMQQPILVRRNTTLTDQEQVAAADISNISETSAFDEASQARRDTQYLKDSPTPTDFAAKLPMSERRGLMQNNGRWNKRKVQQRYESALLAWLCGNDTQLFENLVLDRVLTQKVIDVLTANGSLVYETATKYPELQIREDIYHALIKMQRATRDNFLEITQQLELDGHDVMPENILVYNWLFADATTNRQFLSNYATILANNHESVNAGQDMFGQTVAPISKKDALMQALKKADEAKAELAASRGKKYAPLFTQEGEATDVNLAAAIVSFQNQFAPVAQLNQTAYVSMKGELVGDAIDADQFLGAGDNTRVWLWGNYMLFNDKLDKEHYFERFESVGPDLTYKGKKLTDKYFSELGIAGNFWNGARMQGVIKTFASKIGYNTKKEVIERAKNILNTEEKNYRDHINKVVAKFAKTLGRSKVREIIKDIEDIISGEGVYNGAAVMFPEESKEAQIQNKYRKEGSLDQNFVDVYTALIKAFEYKDTTTSYINGFVGALQDLLKTRAAFNAVKKLDWNKFGGQTGFLVNGMDFQTELSLLMRRSNLFEHDRNRVYELVDNAVRDALIHNKDVDTALKELEEPMLRVLELVPRVNEAVEENLEKFKSEFPTADTKAIAEYLNKYMTTPQNAISGWSPSILISAPTSFSQQDLDLLKKVAKTDDHGISIQKWDMDVTPTLADVIYKIKSARTQQNLLHLAQTTFKNATYEYKPRASMYEVEAPENNELLHAYKYLDKQPKQVQEALINAILAYNKKYPGLSLGLYIESNIPSMFSDTFDYMFKDVFGTQDSIEDIAKALYDAKKYTDEDIDLEDKLRGIAHLAFERAVRMNLNPTIADVKKGLLAEKDKFLNDVYYVYHKERQEIGLYVCDYLLNQIKKQNQKALISDVSNFKGGKLSHNNAFRFLENLVNQMKLHTDYQEELKKDKSLKLTKNPPADEIVIKMLRKFGIKGLKYHGKRDKFGAVTWQKTPIKERLYSRDLSKNLVVTHGISVDKLNKALELGGLPVPSIGISKASDPLQDFGTITLIGTKDIIDPENPSNKVYDRDVWSNMFPIAEYKNATIKEGRAFREKFNKTFIKVGDENALREVEYYATNSKRPYQAIGKFLYSDGAQLYYIENVLGEKFNIPMENKNLIRLDNLMPFVKPDAQFVEEVSKIDSNIDNSDVLRKAVEKPLRDLIERSNVSNVEKDHAKKYFFTDAFRPNSVFNLVSAVKTYKAHPDDMTVDSLALMRKLDSYKLVSNDKYIAWAYKQMEDLLGQPMVKVGNKKLPWTLENLTKAMIRRSVVGSDNIGANIGKVIASGAKKFGSISEIQQAGQQLNTRERANELTDSISNRLSQFASNVLQSGYFDYDFSDVYDALIKVISKPNPTKDSLGYALKQTFNDNTAKFDDALLEEGVQLAKDIKRVTRYYFEAKPQRAVSFNEFAGAVVPTDAAFDESANKLSALGLNVIRSDNLKEGIDQLADVDPDLLFQKRGVVRGFYDPDLQAIVLSKYWNETTLVHEYHHRFLEKLWGYFKEAQTGDRAVSDEFMTDMQQLFNILDIDLTQDQLTVVQQEKFATMVEAYLTGLGVDNPENLAFQSFLHWIPEQYQSILNLGYLDEQGNIVNPVLDEQTIAWFNKWFANPFMPSLATAPEIQHLTNPTDANGEIIPSSQKVMNNREKDWGQDSEEQNKADAQLWRAINENTPNDMRAALDGEKERMKAESNNQPDDTKLPEEHKPTMRERWFKTYQPSARERAAQMAREYLTKNPEHARELAFADPETSTEFDAPVDRAMLIRAVMETVPHGSDEWYILNDNLATVKSMSGSTLSLAGDESHRAYLDAKKEVEDARELKAAVNYAGTRRGALEKWNSDIKAFIAKRTAQIVATEPNSIERKTAIKAFLEEAKTKFSANTTNAVLNQMDLTGMQTKNSQVFIKWAEKQIKQAAHAKIDTAEQKELMKASIAAQLALKDIDSTAQTDGKFTRAVQSAKDIRHWQFVKDKMKKAYIGRWGKWGIFTENLFGGYVPSAMLMSVNTLFFANVPSTAINTGTIRLAAKAIGNNNVDKQIQKDEIERIRQVFNASGVNLAQMDKPTSPSTLHGEKYMNTEQKHWYNFTFEILGRTDNLFRIPTFVDALARIATKNADGDKAKATALFKAYAQLNNKDESAKTARKQALAVANMAVFTQDGTLSTALNHIRSILNTLSRAPLGLDPNGFGLGNVLAPFLKTGANITEMGLSATLALPRTAIMGLKKLQGKQIPDLDKIAIRADWMNLAWTAVMVALLCALSGDDDDWYTEPYQSGRKYDPNKPYDSIRFGNTWVKLDVFGPVAIPLRTAAMTIKDWEKRKLASIGDGMFEALSDTPLVQQFTDSSLDYMNRQPGAYWSGFAYNQANKFVPAQAKTLAKAISRKTGYKLDTTGAGKTIDRKFHRNYGFDGAELTTNDLINLFTNRLKYNPQ